MHLVHPGLTTLNTSNRKKKRNVRQQKAHAEHEQWLRNQGLHPDQLKHKLDSKPRKLNIALSVDRTGPQCTNGFAPGGMKKSVFDSEWTKKYDDDPLLAEREKEALRQAEAKKSNLMPLYNKGPVQYNGGGLKMTELGRRRT